MLYLSKRRAFELFVVLSFAVALFYFLFLRPRVRMMTELRSERKNLEFAVMKSQSDYNRARFAISHLPEREKEYQRLSRSCLSEFGGFVREREIPRFLDMLRGTARSSGVEVIISGNRISKSEDGDRTLIVELEFTASYRRLGRLLVDLERLSTPVFVSSLDIKSEKSFVAEPLLRVKMEVCTYLADVGT